MDEEKSLPARLARVDARCRSNSHRIDELESSQQAVTELALSLRAMANEQANMKEDLGEVKNDVKLLTRRSSVHWDSLVDKLMWLILGGALGLLLQQIVI